MKRTLRAIGIIVLAALILLVCACPNAAALEIGDNAPDFKLTSNNGQEISLSQFRGKVVVVDFWTAWCSKCQKSLIWLEGLQSKLHGRNFQAITINLDETSDGALQFLAKNNLDLVVALDPKASTPETFQLESTPTSFVIDAQGKVAIIHSGFDADSGSELEVKILALLGQEKGK